MTININTEADLFAIKQVASTNAKSIGAVLAEYADQFTPLDDDFRAVLAKSMLPSTYRSNPSMLGMSMLAKLPEFADSSGFLTAGSYDHVTVVIWRKRKPAGSRWTHSTPSVKQLIKKWLDLNLSRHEKLSFKVEDITPFYLTHPEQLTYQIGRETGVKIKILRLTRVWIITRARLMQFVPLAKS